MMFRYSQFEINSANEDRAKKLVSLGIGTISKEKMALCGHCDNWAPVTEIEEHLGRFEHPGDGGIHRTEIDENTEFITHFIFKYDMQKIFNSVKRRLKSIGANAYKSERYWSISINGNEIPIFLLDAPQSTSYLRESITDRTSCLFIYVEDHQISSLTNIFCEYNFIKIDDVLENPSVISKKAEAINTNFSSNDAIELSKTINSLQKYVSKGLISDDEFGQYLSDWFNIVKSKGRNELDSFIEALRRDQRNPCGAKYVPSGGTHPSDFENIVLWDYFNQALMVGADKSYEIKAFAPRTIFNYELLDHKVRTNRLKKLAFLVTNNTVHYSAWTEIFKIYSEQKYWHYIIMDLDLIVLLALGTNTKSYFDKLLKTSKEKFENKNKLDIKP